MKICDTGHFVLDDELASGLINGTIFGIQLNLRYEESSDVFQDHLTEFFRDEGKQISGTICLDNGEYRRLVAFFTGRTSPAHFTYTISEIQEDGDTDDPSHSLNMGKDW